MTAGLMLVADLLVAPWVLLGCAWLLSGLLDRCGARARRARVMALSVAEWDALEFPRADVVDGVVLELERLERVLDGGVRAR